jgi:hypothetical protein
MADQSVARLALVDELAALRTELEAWRRELPQEIAHAEQRGLPHLAVDLRRLHARVEAVATAARVAAKRWG